MRNPGRKEEMLSSNPGRALLDHPLFGRGMIDPPVLGGLIFGGDAKNFERLSG